MRLYPDIYSRRFGWMFADLLMVAWIYLSVQGGLFVNHLVLELDALAQGVIKAGQTFDGWIRSFEQSVPNGVPYISDFLRRTGEALKTHSGDSCDLSRPGGIPCGAPAGADARDPGRGDPHLAGLDGVSPETRAPDLRHAGRPRYPAASPRPTRADSPDAGDPGRPRDLHAPPITGCWRTRTTRPRTGTSAGSSRWPGPSWSGTASRSSAISGRVRRFPS